MSAELAMLLLALSIALYGAVGVLLGRWSITMPMVFMVVGILLTRTGMDLAERVGSVELVRFITEITLVILLFADASTISLARIQQDAGMPSRLLGIGLPLTLVAGALVAWLLFPSAGIAFALLVGSVLAPTDAALGLPIFLNPKVPVRIRRALNVESGLNDGMATPFVSLFLAMAVAESVQWQSGWLFSALAQIAIAVAVGAAVGFVGGRLLDASYRRGLTQGAPLQFSVLALALMAYFGSLSLGGNGFVAAFVGGIIFSIGSRRRLIDATEYSEATGSLLSLVVWTGFGALFAASAIQNAEPRVILFALLSLTVVRMLPVFLATRGLGLRTDTRLLMGWFGPRGLASVVFGLMAVESFAEGSTERSLIASLVTWTILLSVLLHGFSAQPLAGWYARRLAQAPPNLPELEDVPAVEPRRHTALDASALGSKAEAAQADAA